MSNLVLHAPDVSSDSRKMASQIKIGMIQSHFAAQIRADKSNKSK